MTEEPRWPTVNDVADAEAKAGNPPWLSSPPEVARAISMCRAAWRASIDDPSQSPVGEVRAHPVTGKATIRAVHAIGLETSHYPWTLVDDDGVTHGMTHCNVKGWPIIGSVPATPASALLP